MEQAQILFPDLPPEPPAARVIPFQPRRAGRATHEPRRLSGDGLAQRLRRDVQRQIDHRRRMLAHLEAQSQA
jgi:hypothetical protein